MNMKFQIIYFAVEVMPIARKCYGGFLQIMTYSVWNMYVCWLFTYGTGHIRGCEKIISLIFDLDATAKSDNTM